MLKTIWTSEPAALSTTYDQPGEGETTATVSQACPTDRVTVPALAAVYTVSDGGGVAVAAAVGVGLGACVALGVAATFGVGVGDGVWPGGGVQVGAGLGLGVGVGVAVVTVGGVPVDVGGAGTGVCAGVGKSARTFVAVGAGEDEPGSGASPGNGGVCATNTPDAVPPPLDDAPGVAGSGAGAAGVPTTGGVTVARGVAVGRSPPGAGSSAWPGGTLTARSKAMLAASPKNETAPFATSAGV